MKPSQIQIRKLRFILQSFLALIIIILIIIILEEIIVIESLCPHKANRSILYYGRTAASFVYLVLFYVSYKKNEIHLLLSSCSPRGSKEASRIFPTKYNLRAVTSEDSELSECRSVRLRWSELVGDPGPSSVLVRVLRDQQSTVLIHQQRQVYLLQ